jgi:hypothetical protein
MNKLSRYRWYRRMSGGHWLQSRSCGWFPVSAERIDEYLIEMPSYITAIEDNRRYQDDLLCACLIAVSLICAVIGAALITGAISP